jgi:exopolysaccharide production protein ExoZ
LVALNELVKYNTTEFRIGRSFSRLLRYVNRLYLLDRKGRYESLEGLRGLAVLMVISVHFFYRFIDPAYLVTVSAPVGYLIKFLQRGQIGVDLFFVLSGFFIARSMRSSRPSLQRFMGLRFQRLLPAHIAVLLYIMISTGFPALKIILCNLFFVSAFVNKMPVMNYVTWSLGYELLFYIGYGLWEMASRKSPVLRSDLAFALVALITWTSQWWFSPILTAVSHGMLTMPEMNRFMGFFWGILLARTLESEKISLWLKDKLPMLIIPALLALIIYQWNFEWGRQHKPFYFVSLDLIFAVIMANLIFSKTILTYIFRSKILRLFGVLSYSLYLCHPVCLTLLSNSFNSFYGIEKLLVAFAVSMPFCLLVSSAIFVTLERSYFTKKYLSVALFKKMFGRRLVHTIDAKTVNQSASGGTPTVLQKK